MTLPTALLGLLLGAESCAVVLAVRLRPRAWPLIAALVFALVNEATIGAFHHWIFTAPDHPLRVALIERGPWVRWPYHLETALVLGWPCALALAAHLTFFPPIKRRLDGLAGLYLGTITSLVLCFPLQQGRTKPVLYAFELVAVAVAWSAVWLGRARANKGVAHSVIVLLLCFETISALVGPWGRNVFHDWAVLGSALYLVCFTIASGVLWMHRPRS